MNCILVAVRKTRRILKKLCEFFDVNNPFESPWAYLKNVDTGIIADERINCDDSCKIGHKIMSKMNNLKFKEIKLLKSDQAKTFSVLRKPTKINKEDVFISSNELYQRIILTVCNIGPPNPEIFSYESTPVASSLFHDDGSFRNFQKKSVNELYY